jgi:hypothetical protein
MGARAVNNSEASAAGATALVEWARAIAGPRPSENRTCELAPHPAQAWIKPPFQGAGTGLSRAGRCPVAIRNRRRHDECSSFKLVSERVPPALNGIAG